MAAYPIQFPDYVDHFQSGEGSIMPTIAMIASRPFHCLLDGVSSEYAKDHWYARRSGH